MDNSIRQIEDVITQVIDDKVDNLVSKEEFKQGHNQIMNGLDKITGKFTGLEQEYIFIKEWIDRFEKRDKETQSVISELSKKISELEKQLS